MVYGRIILASAIVDAVERYCTLMKRNLLLGILVTLAMVVAHPAQGPTHRDHPVCGLPIRRRTRRIGELTTTLDIEESPAWGLIFDIDITGLDQVEVYYSSQGTELDRGTASSPKVTIDTLQIGAIHQYAPRSSRQSVHRPHSRGHSLRSRRRQRHQVLGWPCRWGEDDRLRSPRIPLRRSGLRHHNRIQ